MGQALEPFSTAQFTLDQSRSLNFFCVDSANDSFLSEHLVRHVAFLGSAHAQFVVRSDLLKLVRTDMEKLGDARHFPKYFQSLSYCVHETACLTENLVSTSFCSALFCADFSLMAFLL